MPTPFTSSLPPLVWSPPGIPGLLVIDRTDDDDAMREFERLQRPRSIPPLKASALRITPQQQDTDHAL